jgi:hypothetical protein
MDHAWCKDIERDAAVRAAEDGRDRPLPTLGECIDGMFPKSVSASSPVEQENKGDGIGVTESLSVDARGEEMAQVNFADAAERSSTVSDADGLRQRVAELEAASGGGEGEPVAWMVEWTDHAELYGSKTQAERAAAGDVVPQPLYRQPPQPRGWLTEQERDLIAGITDDDEYTEEGQDIAKGLLARSSPPEVVLPQEWGNVGRDVVVVKSEVIDALAAAGVAVKETT